jgi:hypothetical protein
MSESVARDVLKLLLSAALISVPVLDECAAALAEANTLRVQDHNSVEEDRCIREADRIVERLTELSLSDIEPEALGRYGDLLAAANGLTMKWVGPVAHAFRSDKSAVSTIMGPYGSAKTTTAFQKIINSLLWQPKGADGVRRARWCVVRDTYGHLYDNVMADFFLWFPKTKDNFKLTPYPVYREQFDIPMGNGKVEKLELEMLFRAVDTQSAEELFKGMALTGLWLNEMDTLHHDVFKFGFPRVGRYRHPGTPRGGWSGVIGDMNAPAEDNWTYDFNVNKNIGLSSAQMASYQALFGDHFKVSFHVQPGGLDAGAENVANLPDGYYERLQIGKTEQEIRRFIHNKFGAVRDGNPVYAKYNDEIHCVPGLKADPRLAVHLGVDGGSTPACLFGQKTDAGQIRVVDECVIFKPNKDDTLESLGGKEFGQECGRYWNDNFGGMELGVSWADPSCWYGDNEKNVEDRAWIYKFVEGFNETAIGVKLKMKPAPIKGNRVGPRIAAVSEVLTIQGQPGYVISDRCRVTREGYNRGYVTVRVQYSTGGGRWKDEPLKNDFSHAHDGNQYLVLGLTKFEGWEDAADRQSRANNAARLKGGRVKHGNGYFSSRKAA